MDQQQPSLQQQVGISMVFINDGSGTYDTKNYGEFLSH
jgi:hypothetical protein